MATHIADSGSSDRRGFQKVLDVFLAGAGLPFSSVISAERIERIFAKHGSLFGQYGVYSTAMIVWSFLGQVLRDGKEAACQSAVARVVCFCQMSGLEAPTQDTGDYCRARAKLSEAALRELSCEVAEETENSAEEGWLWKGMHAKLIDGFTFTMPDTAANQAQYPQADTQAPGVGLPIARAVTVTSLSTACVMDAAVGPYKGKGTGEPALLRSMLSALKVDDVAVMDRYYCSFMMIALLLNRGTHVCARKHPHRHTDFRRGRRLGKHDQIIVWARPKRPDWMDEAAYKSIPVTLELRELQYKVVRPGCRTKTLTVITTLTDVDRYSSEDIAELYGFRWNAELDIRSIKATLNLSHLRCKSPEMVRRELWATLLAYNLIRTTAAAAALVHKRRPRQISFTSTCQYVLVSWMVMSCGLIDSRRLAGYCQTILKQIAACEVADRPGRFEPRVLKRRRHGYKLMQQPRNDLRAQLRNTANKRA